MDSFVFLLILTLVICISIVKSIYFKDSDSNDYPDFDDYFCDSDDNDSDND